MTGADVTELEGSGGVTVSTSDPMPAAEEGHQVSVVRPAAATSAGVFDPNAARRLAEGRGPGLQDSEAFQPAHWAPV